MSTNHLPDCELTPPVKAKPGWHAYFEVDGQRVAESTGATTTQNPYGPATALTHTYLHLDDQGTISMVTNDNFNANTLTPIPQNELSDVFGQPRLTTGATDPSWGANDVTKRRYINQEDLTDAHLIDLNARIYDPCWANSSRQTPSSPIKTIASRGMLTHTLTTIPCRRKTRRGSRTTVARRRKWRPLTRTRRIQQDRSMPGQPPRRMRVRQASRWRDR
jgi:hypothetical protein